MMKEKAALVIAAIMMTSIAAMAVSTSVSATHEPTVSISENLVRENTSVVLTITVQNGGPDAIDNVRIVVPSTFTINTLTKIPKDSVVQLSGSEVGNDNIVVLPAGTTLSLLPGENIVVPSGTVVIRKAGDNVRAVTTGVWYLLSENASLKLQQDSRAQLAGENVETTVENEFTLDNGDVKLVSDTQVIVLSGNIVKLPENTLVYLTADRNVTVGENTYVKMAEEENVVLDNGTSTTVTDVSAKKENVEAVTIAAGTLLELPATVGGSGENEVVLPVGTLVKLENAIGAVVAENTRVIRKSGENLLMTSETAAAAENQPVGWTQTTGTSTLPTGNFAEWAGIGDNKIASGAQLDFPFALITPTAGGDYTIYVRTTDAQGALVQKEITLTVDNTPPTVSVSVSPDWVKDNVTVTITVTASEPLAKLENVMVAENNGENVQISMTPNADNTVWTGTYTTGDNIQRDGTATVYVIGSQLEDLVGHTAVSDNTGTFTIDRIAPPAPVLDQIAGFPQDMLAALPGVQTNVGSYLLENCALDNVAGALQTQKGMTVKIRIDNTTYTATTGDGGYWHYQLSLTEGTHVIGIKIIDKAGNEGTENVENVTFDKTAPTITFGTIGGKAFENGVVINDNTPTLTLTITDAVLGVENLPFSDNGGYSVQLQYENGTVIATLANALAHDNYTLNFENTIPLAIGSFTGGLPDNTYRIFVIAGDNLQSDNKSYTFVVDTKAPSVPVLTTSYPTSTADKPKALNTTTITISGTCEPYATINVYTSVSPWTTATLATTVTDSDGDGIWVASLDITAGVTTKIEVSQTDVAGNESERTLYGYVKADATPPTISELTIDGKAVTSLSTSKSSVIVSGKVTDDVSEPTEIELRISYGDTSITVPLEADGSFSKSIRVFEGSNVITLIATDAAGNTSPAISLTVERTVTPTGTYAIILVIIALVLAAIAILRVKK